MSALGGRPAGGRLKSKGAGVLSSQGVPLKKSMSHPSITEFMNALPGRYNPGPGGAAAVVQFHFTGENTADWHLELDGAACRTSPGAHADPAVTLTVDSADFMALLSGELQPMPAFMQGKLKLSGDVGLAMKIPGMFR